jgi:pimeloyl-ACP methyl ester carboxylesterase
VAAMPVALANGMDLHHDTAGEPEDPALLLIAGLGGQSIGWPTELVQAFVDRGFRVITFDNRDVGLSSRVEGSGDTAADLRRLVAGEAVTPPYTLADLALDVVGLLDHLGIDAAHVLGTSMGGMVAQQLAIDHPDRVLSLTSISSTTGEPDVGQPHAEVLELMFAAAPEGREASVQRALEVARAIGSPDQFDEDRVRQLAEASFDRAPDTEGVLRQLLAVVTAPDRAAGLAALAVPTLVIHGEVDRLVDPSGGERTAELVPGAELVLIEGMGHDLPVPVWSRIIELVTRHAASASVG